MRGCRPPQRPDGPEPLMLPIDPVDDPEMASSATTAGLSEADADDRDGSDKRARLGRSAAIITAFNLVSRISGFMRVIAVAGALGIAFLGDTYQRSNEVSNVLFELLAGGLLFSVLIPSFVDLLHDRDPDQARRLGGVLVTRGVAVVAVVALVGMVASTWIMRALTVGVPADTRLEQIRLGSFLLWFVMPQLVFYMAGSVASALLQADHRFVATSVAPVFNNVAVTATMIAFAIEHDPARGFALTVGEKWLLGGGTLIGTVAMTIVPFVALWRAGLAIHPRWKTAGLNLRPLLLRGAWGAGHVGLNEVLIFTTIVLSGRVDGGVIAYQTAFTFFLLPHALLAYPIFTALFPRLARRASAKHHAPFAADMSLGIRLMMLLLLPAAGLMAVMASPALSVVRLGRLDAHGVHLVAMVLAAYLSGLPGYSIFFLLTRASYALGDARRPTLVNLGLTAASIIGMVVATTLTQGIGLLVAYGLIQAVAVSIGSAVLFMLIRSSVGHPVPVLSTISRATLATAIATVVSVAVVAAIRWHGRITAIASVAAVGVVGCAVYVAVLVVVRTPELEMARTRATKMLRRTR